EQLQQGIDALDEAAARSVLFQLAQHNVPIANFIYDHYAKVCHEEAARNMDFDHHSKDVWHQLNTRYSSMSGSKQYEQAGEVFRDIISTLETIVSSVAPHSSFSTKRSALATVRKIGKGILLSHGCIPHEVLKDFQYESSFEDSVAKIISYMTEAERVKMSEADDGEFPAKLRELVALSEGHEIFVGLAKSLAILMGESDGQV
ncbi:hypothetical protein K402DRAFT_328885, partial [Aulographum hederae CBS 113979]